MKFEAVLFDMDGTLLDTIADLGGALNHTLEENGYPRRSREEIRSFVGNGARRLVRLALPESVDEAEAERVLKLYQAYYLAHPCVETCPYPGIADVVAELQRRGVKTAIVSNKPHDTACALGARFFPGMLTVGDDGVHPRKPAPDNVYRALALLGAAPERTAYVGDSEVDLATGRNSGTTPVIVGWGYRRAAELRQSGVPHVVETMGELLENLL